jgi:hypothetical protein
MDRLREAKNDAQILEYFQDSGLVEALSLFKRILNVDLDKVFTIKMTGHWADFNELYKIWKKMSKDGEGRWENIKCVSEGDPDYFVVINSPHQNDLKSIVPSRTIVFQMEPDMEKKVNMWGAWASPGKNTFYKVITHKDFPNLMEWHLSKTYSQLQTETIEKTKNKEISTVLSGKYTDPGHKQRIDFVKFLELKNDIHIDVFGNNRFNYVRYLGNLPDYQKDNAIFPYKYTFNCENHNTIDNYVTEKLYDAILGEALCFYSGPENVKTLVDERCYVRLDLLNKEKSYETVKKAIEEDWWSQRIDVIRSEKKRILDTMSVYPVVSKILQKKY